MSLVAQRVGTVNIPTVLIVKNGGDDGTSFRTNEARGLGKVGSLEMLSIYIPSNSGITNIDLKAYYAKVTNASGAWRVTTHGQVSTANFETNNPDFFQGNQTRSVNAGWNVIPFQMSSNMVNDVLMLVVPIQTASNLPYQGGALFSIDSGADGFQEP